MTYKIQRKDGDTWKDLLTGYDQWDDAHSDMISEHLSWPWSSYRVVEEEKK